MMNIMCIVKANRAGRCQYKQHYKQYKLDDINFFFNIADFILYFALVLNNFGIVTSINYDSNDLISIF